MIRFYLFIVLACLCTCLCTKPTVRLVPEAAPGEPGKIFRLPGDTVTIAVEFAGRKEQREFLKNIDSFFTAYRLDTLHADTIRNYFVLRLVERKERAPSPPESLGIVERGAFVEGEIVLPPDTSTPSRGGSVSIYSPRAWPDPLFSALVSAQPSVAGNDFPQQGPGDTSQMLSVQKVAGNKIRIALRRELRSAAGKRLTAFDLVEAWLSYVKKYPAEGDVMFGNVKGFNAFIRGQETVVPGVQIRDEKNVVMQLERDDGDALLRLASHRLLPPSLGQGPYALNRISNNTVTLTSNQSYPGGAPYAERIAYISGEDKTPLVSYSLNRYDLVALTFASDLEYARRSLMNDSWLAELPAERYFIALRIGDSGERHAIVSALNTDALMGGIGRIESSRISAVESDPTPESDVERPPAKSGGVARDAADTSRIRILFQSDDPLSVKIAEKLLASISRQAPGCRLEGLEAERCSDALYNKNWEIAIGWIGRNVLTSEHERLRLATVWFDGMRDEARRIRECREVPLFSVKRYALCKNRVGLYRGDIAMIFVRK